MVTTNHTIGGNIKADKTTTDWHLERKQLRSWLLITKMSVYKNTKEKF